MKAKKKRQQGGRPQRGKDRLSKQSRGEENEKTIAELMKRKRELEEQLFRQTVWNEALEELINVAEENFNIKIRMNHSKESSRLQKKRELGSQFCVPC